MVEQADLEEVLAQRTCLDVVVVRLRYSSQEVHGVGIAQVVVESGEDESLGFEDLLFGEAVIRDMLEVLHVGREDFFVFRSDEHGSDADELKLLELDDAGGKEAVDDVDGEKNGFWQKVESSVNLNQPIDENTAQVPLQVVLMLHVVGVGHGSLFQYLEMIEDLHHIFSHHERIVNIFGIQVSNGLGESLLDLDLNLLGCLDDNLFLRLGDALCDHGLLLRRLILRSRRRFFDGLLATRGSRVSLLVHTSHDT